MSVVVLETKNLSHIYSEGTTSRVDAIRDICLKIEKGELVPVQRKVPKHWTYEEAMALE